LNHIFQARFFNLVGEGIFHPRPERPPFQAHQNILGIPFPPHVLMRPEPPANDGWKEIVHHPIVHHHIWSTASFPLPPPPLKNQVSQVDPTLSPVQSSHANKILKTDVHEPVQDKGKEIATHSNSSKDFSKSVSSRLHLKDDCSHVISEIQPQGSDQSKAATEKSKGDNNEKRPNASHSKYGF
jgi:hypothetical protein